jgi:hypothetical protein
VLFKSFNSRRKNLQTENTLNKVLYSVTVYGHLPNFHPGSCDLACSSDLIRTHGKEADSGSVHELSFTRSSVVVPCHCMNQQRSAQIKSRAQPLWFQRKKIKPCIYACIAFLIFFDPSLLCRCHDETRSQCSKSSIWGVSFAQNVKSGHDRQRIQLCLPLCKLNLSLSTFDDVRLKQRMRFLTFWNGPGKFHIKVNLNFKLIHFCPNHCFYQIRSQKVVEMK